MSSGNRKRSRWGPPDVGGGHPGPKEEQKAPASVSDHDALQALLSSAEARQKEKEASKRDYSREGKSPFQKKPKREHVDPKNDYYGPGGGSKGDRYYRDDDNRAPKEKETEEGEAPVEKQKANFGLSGALAKDGKGGNVYKGVLLKFREPAEARAPNTQWRLYVFKGEEQIEVLHIAKQSAYLIGRNEEIADIPLQHPSISSQHAVLQYRALPNKETGRLNCQPYLMDLESTNGSFLNGVRIDPARYYQLKKGDVLKFGASTREYVLLTANTTSIK